MKQRIITGLIFTGAVALLIVPGIWLPFMPMVFFAVIAFAASQELRQAFFKRGMHVQPMLAPLNAVVVLLPGLFVAIIRGTAASPATVTAITLFLIFAAMGFLTVLHLILTSPKTLPESGLDAMLIAYIAFPLSCPVIIMAAMPDGFLWMLLGLITPWISDTAAFFSGTLFGRHKIVPHLSPKKTVEGSVGGIIGTMLVVMLYFFLFMQGRATVSPNLTENMILAAIAGFLLSVASQMGDWLASAIKRWCGVKDFGTILPGHGGLLDRFDSVLFTMPVVLAVAAIAMALV